MYCSKCGDRLSPKEIAEINQGREESGWHTPPICGECWDLETNPEPEFDNFSDADSGL